MFPHKDGNITVKIPYKKGKEYDVKIGCFGDGTVEREFVHKNGRLNGLYKEYYESGVLAYCCNYVDDKIDGIAVSYDYNSNKKRRKELCKM